VYVQVIGTYVLQNTNFSEDFTFDRVVSTTALYSGGSEFVYLPGHTSVRGFPLSLQ